MGHQYLIDTQAEPSTCSRCRAPLLVGHDGGVPVRLDPVPIAHSDDADRSAEVAVLVAGGETYLVTPGRWIMDRSPERIRNRRPAGNVHTRHRCPGRPEPTGQPDLWGSFQ